MPSLAAITHSDIDLEMILNDPNSDPDLDLDFKCDCDTSSRLGGRHCESFLVLRPVSESLTLCIVVFLLGLVLIKIFLID